MDKKTEKELKRRLHSLKTHMDNIGPVMRGSVVKLGTKCGNPKGKCAQGEKHVQYYFSLSKDRKTKLIFLGNDRVAKANQYAANYRKLLELIEEMTSINIELVKANVAK